MIAPRTGDAPATTARSQQPGQPRPRPGAAARRTDEERALTFAYNLAALGIELRRDGEETVNGYGEAMTPMLQGEIDRRTADLIRYVPELEQPHGCVRARR